LIGKILNRAASLLVAGAFVLGPTTATADTLVPHTAVYKLKISIAGGTLTTAVRESGAGFYVQSVIEPKGLAALLTSGSIEESSQFSVDEQGVRPLIYASKNTLSSDNEFMHFTFDYDAGVVSGTFNEEAYEYPLDEAMHDRVSIQYELMHSLMTGKPDTEYRLLDGDEIKDITVRNIGTRQIEVPLGRFEAVGIQHEQVKERPKGILRRVTTLWCAEELGYLPVLIEQSRNGKARGRAELVEYEPGMPGETSASPTLTSGH
jgi:hypothetical protein